MTLRAFSLQASVIVLAAVSGLAARPSAAQEVRPTQRQAAPSVPNQGSMPADDAGEYRVDFSAGRVEVDVRLNELELADDVLVVVDRYRLTADELKLSRSDRGIVVDGYGRVAFCRCEDPPVTVSFSGATVAPPTDLLIEDPALRVWGVPVFWLPYLWLRSPSRMGLLPPRIAYSTQDGFLAGAGVHVPFSQKSFVDLEAAGYFEGGVDLRARIATPSNAVRLRWDHLHESMIGVDARGVVHTPGFTSASYRVDALRGERALAATPILLDAAQRYDRARGEVGRHHGRVYYGAGAFMTAARGGAIDELGAWGPTLTLGVGEALGGLGEFDLATKLWTVDDVTEESRTRLEQRALARWHARPGPLSLEVEGAGAGGVNTSPRDAQPFASVGAALELGLPLRRRFGRTDPLLHYVTPLFSASGLYEIERDLVEAEVGSSETGPGERNDGEARLGQISGGVRTSVGRWGERSSLQLEGRAGWVKDDARVARLVMGRALAASDFLGASLHGVTDIDVIGHWEATARTRFGPESSHHLALYVEGQQDLDSRSGRVISGDVLSTEPPFAWYDADGLSSGAEMMLKWSRALSTAVGADMDVKESTLLGVRGSLAYRHPCGCLATVAWAGHRLARRGVDAWLTLDLIP
ncbi:MAG TPA: hypothetical protein VI197_33005 [Polyangiaceae bacterium]